MNNKINNPYLKQLISEIANKTAEGRITGVSWGLIDEAKKKKKIKEADEKKDEKPADDKGGDLPPLDSGKDKGADAGGDTTGDLPPLGGSDEKPKDAKAPEGGDAPKADAAPDAGNEEDADKAKEDAVKAKAELEKAKAEQDKAKNAIKNQSYIKLTSSDGTQYLIGKLLKNALTQGGTIDALAGDMVQKLNIKTQEDVNNFSEDVAHYMSIPGMSQLVSSMKGLVTKSASSEEPSA